MRSNLAQWTRFAWDLDKLPDSQAPLPSRYVVRQAVRPDKAAVWKVIEDSLALDAAWNETFSELRPFLSEQIDDIFDSKDIPCLALTHGTRIIGVSALSQDADAENHLLSGPCVFSEYRNRGLGTVLLDRSLRELRGAGLHHAYGVTKRLAPAAKFVYPKFAGESAPYELEHSILAS